MYLLIYKLKQNVIVFGRMYLTREEWFNLFNAGGHSWGKFGLGLRVRCSGFVRLHGSQGVPI